MKKLTHYLVVLFVATLMLNGVKGTSQELDNTASEFEMLVQHFEANGNFINSDMAPAVILPSEINDNLKNKKYLVLDIRSESWFAYGHIKGAKNVKGPELLNYFKNDIDPATFDKITIVCYSGQSAAYYATLLRLYGFNNVYFLKWGMSSWNEEFSTNYWVKNSTDNFVDKLETTENTIPEKGNMPTLNTGKSAVEDILKARVEQVFAQPYGDYAVKAENVVDTTGDYFIVNYVNEEIHNAGHLAGAVRYEPRSLSMAENLLTLPTDKKILIGCTTGFSAASAMAYLNVLGYDAYNLAYGSNSLMNSTLVEKGWNGFSKNEVNNYQVVE